MSETDVPMVMCRKLGATLPALTRLPWPGALGQRIMAEISAQAWSDWKEHGKMLLNENRVNLGSDEGRVFMTAQMMAYLFGEGVLREAEGFTPKHEH